MTKHRNKRLHVCALPNVDSLHVIQSGDEFIIEINNNSALHLISFAGIFSQSSSLSIVLILYVCHCFITSVLVQTIQFYFCIPNNPLLVHTVKCRHFLYRGSSFFMGKSFFFAFAETS